MQQPQHSAAIEARLAQERALLATRPRPHRYPHQQRYHVAGHSSYAHQASPRAQPSDYRAAQDCEDGKAFRADSDATVLPVLQCTTLARRQRILSERYCSHTGSANGDSDRPKVLFLPVLSRAAANSTIKANLAKLELEAARCCVAVRNTRHVSHACGIRDAGADRRFGSRDPGAISRTRTYLRNLSSQKP